MRASTPPVSPRVVALALSFALAFALVTGCGTTHAPSALEDDASSARVTDAGAMAPPSELDAETAPDAGACTPLVNACSEPRPSYSADIVPIFERHCNGCHSPTAPSGPWPFDAYNDVIDWRKSILTELEACTMPPPDAGAFPEEERQRIAAWFGCDAPSD